MNMTTDDTAELLPCPFCGGEAAIDKSYEVGEYAGCRRCDYWILNRMDNWNRRVAPPDLTIAYTVGYLDGKKAACGALSRDEVRAILMQYGFTIKEGQTDLKPYVYDAAYALIEAAFAKDAS